MIFYDDSVGYVSNMIFYDDSVGYLSNNFIMVSIESSNKKIGSAMIDLCVKFTVEGDIDSDLKYLKSWIDDPVKRTLYITGYNRTDVLLEGAFIRSYDYYHKLSIDISCDCYRIGEKSDFKSKIRDLNIERVLSI